MTVSKFQPSVMDALNYIKSNTSDHDFQSWFEFRCDEYIFARTTSLKGDIFEVSERWPLNDVTHWQLALDIMTKAASVARDVAYERKTNA